MDVKNIKYSDLFISQINVRKTLDGNEDETNLSDLASDIKRNGLINPITVRAFDDKYEIIAGQRRYLAMGIIQSEYVPCNILDITDEKAEELSLTENIQRNCMTIADKVNVYSKLYKIHNNDLTAVSKMVSLSESTLKKYIQISSLSPGIIKKMDLSTDEKITMGVAVELSKLHSSIDKNEAINIMGSVSNVERIATLKKFNNSESKNIGEFEDLITNRVCKAHGITIASPFTIDRTGKHIAIPESMWFEIADMMNNKTPI